MTHGLRVAKTVPNVERTLMGGGADNVDDFDIEFSSAKLRNGATYTLVCKSYGVLSALDFVAIHEPKKKAAKKKKAKKKAAKKRAVKKKAPRKRAKKKAVKKKAAPKKARAKKRVVRKRPARKAKKK